MASVSGLASGIDTSGLIRQLMELEARPQAQLRSKQAFIERAITGYQSINTKMLAIATAAQELTTGTGWTLAKATSSDTSRVSVTASAGAAASSLRFSVEQLARAGSAMTSGTGVAAADVVTSASQITVHKGSTATAVTLGADKTVGGVAKSINDADLGVTATAVQVSTGVYKLQVVSTTTGADTTVDIDDGAGGAVFTAALGETATLATAQDALLYLEGNAASPVTRASNTFSDLLDGVTFTLLKAEAGTLVTVDAGADAGKTADKIQALVDAANSALADMKSLTKYDSETKKAAVLAGDSVVRGLQQSLLGKVSGDATTSSGLYGVSVTSDGTLAFDRTKFLDAYAADPAAVQETLGLGTTTAPGLAERLRGLADGATRSTTAEGGAGLLTTAIDTRQREITGITARITDWDDRLKIREQTLVRQFTAMERALGTMQQQSQWLAGQIGGLMSMGAQ